MLVIERTCSRHIAEKSHKHGKNWKAEEIDSNFTTERVYVKSEARVEDCILK